MDVVTMTVAEFAAWADPPVSLRTMKRLSADLTPAETRRTLGRPARAYDVADLAAAHAAWVEQRHARDASDVVHVTNVA